MNKIVVLALILAVIIGECLAAFLFLGRAEPAANAASAADIETSDGAQKKEHSPAAQGKHADAEKKGHDKKEIAAGHESAKHGHGQDKHGYGEAKPAAAKNTPSQHGHSINELPPSGENREVDLGEYSIMATDPASSTMLLVDFHIFGTVAASDIADFERLYEENRHRIRHQVIIIVRSAEMGDLTDPSLGLIGRQVLEKTNQLLGQPLVQEIIFSKFSFIEQ